MTGSEAEAPVDARPADGESGEAAHAAATTQATRPSVDLIVPPDTARRRARTSAIPVSISTHLRATGAMSGVTCAVSVRDTL